MDYSLDLFAYIDGHGHYQYVSRSYADFYGFSIEELLGHQPQDVFDPESYEKIIRPNLEKCLSEKLPVNYQAWIVPKKVNNPRYLYCTYLPHIAKDSGEVSGVIVMAKDVTEFKRAEGLLSRSANTDALTNIPNRLYLESKLTDLTKSSSRVSDRFALMFCDLDGFKQVNDQYGHAIGDKILYQVASRLNATIRKNDVLARYGGDEFAILLTNLSEDNVVNVVKQKIEKAIMQPFDVSGHQISIGISIGVAVYPDESLDKTQLLDYADKRMYQCKNSKQ